MTEEILRMEPDEGLEKIAEALKICHLYRNLYFTKRAGLQAYFKEKAVVEWDFQPSLIFSRLDSFINQLKMIEVDAQTHNAQLGMAHSPSGHSC